MNFLFVFLCLFFFAQSQDTINVYRFPFNQEIDSFEQSMLKSVFSLYDNKSKTQTTLKFFKVKSFKELFTILEKPENKNNSFSISSITITKERKKKFDFSPRYMPIRYGIIALKERKIANWKNSGLKFGYIQDTTDEIYVKKFNKTFNFKMIGFNSASEKFIGLNSGNIDVMLSEIVSNFKDEKLVVLENILLEEDGYGIAFPKNSELLPKLRSYISYYTKSKKYYTLLRKAYGKDIAKILHQTISNDR